MILNKCIFNYSINSTMTKHSSLVWLGKMHNLYHWHIFDQPANNRALRSLVIKAVQSSFLLCKKHISNDCKEWSPVYCSDPVVVGPQPSPSGLQQVEYTRTRFAWGKALLSAPCSALLSSVTNTAGPFFLALPEKDQSLSMVFRSSRPSKMTCSSSVAAMMMPSGSPPATLWVRSRNTLHPSWSMFPEESMKHNSPLCFRCMCILFINGEQMATSCLPLDVVITLAHWSLHALLYSCTFLSRATVNSTPELPYCWQSICKYNLSKDNLLIL